MEQVSADGASPLIMACQKCDNVEYTEIQLSPPWEPDDETAKHFRVVYYKLEDRPGPEVLLALRKLSDGLVDLPIKNAIAAVEEAPFVDLGVYQRDDAQALVRDGKSMGLELVLENPHENLHDEETEWDFTFSEPGVIGVIPGAWIMIGIFLLIGVILFLVLR